MDPLVRKHKINNELNEELSPRKRHKPDKIITTKTWKPLDENQNPDQIENLDITIPSENTNAMYHTKEFTPIGDNILPAKLSAAMNNSYAANVTQPDSENIPNFMNSLINDSGLDTTGADDHNITYPEVNNSIEIYTDLAAPTVQLGRPIVNTSLIKLAQQNQYKGRSPLANVVSNKNTNVVVPPPATTSFIESVYQKKSYLHYSGEDNFAKLSDEMILSIFKWLPKKTLIRCSYVCRRFSAIAQDESLWARLDLAGKHIAAGALGRVLNRGVIILRLAQAKITEPIFEMNEVPADFCSKLQYLDLSMAIIIPAALRDLLAHCKYLKKLSLEHVPLDASISNAIASNRNLEALNLTMCTGIDARSIRTMMTEFRTLHSLNISWTSLNMDSVNAFVETAPANLLRLNMSGCRKSMTDNSVAQLVAKCPQLIELDLSDCTILTSETIKIVSKLKYLEYLSLSRCYNIAVAAYLTINELISLMYLDIFGVLSDQAVSVLQATYPNVIINKFIHSAVARPTVGNRRTSVWGLRTRD